MVVGEDFRFGHRARGTIDTLRAEGASSGFSVSALPLQGDGAERWSSTMARSLIADGDVAGAAEVLGRDYRLDGTVVHGDHRGRELGYPTANLAWSGSPAVPADGVYAGWVTTRDAVLPAAISVGTNPQFQGRERRVIMSSTVTSTSAATSSRSSSGSGRDLRRRIVSLVTAWGGRRHV